MKILTLGYNLDKQGGGYSFLRNFRKCFKDNLVEAPEECDIYFITSVSMLEKLSVIPKNKKIVLRVDNILKRSCNRDIYPFEGGKVTMMEAMKILARKADLVVYQSEWSKDLLDDFLKPNRSTVIMNSVDESIFNPDGARIPTDKEVYFYSRSSNHDNKQWHKAYYQYQYDFRKNKNSELWISGRFSPENIPNRFDFFRDEPIRYLGFVTDPENMACFMRTAKYFYMPYSYDSCSNTLIENLLCGGDPIVLDNSGGTQEIIDKYGQYGAKFFHLKRMANEYEEMFKMQ